MKTVPIFLVLLCFSVNAVSQTQSFDILTFSPPKNWKKETKKGSIVYSKSNKATKGWCQLIVFTSQPGKGTIEMDFDNNWSVLAKSMGIVQPPQEIVQEETDGWKIKSGTGEFRFNNEAAVTSITTFSGYGISVTVMANTNTQEYVPLVQKFIESINLKKPGKNKIPPVTAPTPALPAKNRYTFTTSTFDDGWVAVEQADWVQVTKGNTRVLIHYPNPVTNEYITNRDKSVTVAWNNLVAPRYNNLKNYFVFNNAMDPESPMFVSGNVTEKRTGKNVYVVLFERGKSGWLEFISADKTDFIKNFGIDQSTLTFYQDLDSWTLMKKMATYNKFAIGPADINGNWTNDFTGITQYVNTYTGNSAGMSTFQSRQLFEFLPGTSYQWTLSVASGMVGDIKGKTTKASGKYNFPSIWQIRFSDISGKPAVYDAYFSCIKGTRVLWLSNTGYPGFDAYGRKE